MSKQRRIPTPSWQRDSGLSGGLSGSRLQLYAIIGVAALVVIAVGVVAAGFLMDYIDDQQRPGSTALKVDDRDYTVREYTERAKLYVKEQGGATAQASVVLPTLTQDIVEESILLEYAAAESVEATDDEIKAEIAKLLGITADDPNFDARFQEELGTTDLSEQLYREMAQGNVLREKMVQHFQDALPATAESINYRIIQVPDQETADELKAQIDGGADFAEIAKAQSLDTATKEAGGAVGWVPRGYLADSTEDILFGLEVNETIAYPTSNGFFIYQVTEKEDAHAIDEDKRPTLASQDYQDWLTEKRDAIDLENNVDGSDADIINWIVDHAELSRG